MVLEILPFQNFTIWTALKHNLWKSNTENIINTIQLKQKNMFQSKTKGCHTSTHTINEDYSTIDTAPCCYRCEEERCTWNANKSIYSRQILMLAGRPQLKVQQRWQHMSTLDPTWFTTPPIPIQRPQYMQNTSHSVQYKNRVIMSMSPPNTPIPSHRHWQDCTLHCHS